MELEAKECPYCGNIVMAGEGEEAEDVCTCAEAERRRDLKLRYDKLLSAAENCLGKECGKKYPSLKPVSEVELNAVREIIGMLCSELISSASLGLIDGTSLKINLVSVERRAISRRKEQI